MKLKVEVRVCDLCLPKRVPMHRTASISGLRGGHPLVRDLCLQHASLLTREPEAQEAEPEPLTQPLPKVRMGRTMEALLKLVNDEPGLHPRDYAVKLKVSGTAASQAGRHLIRYGLLTTSGGRAGTRYWPVEQEADAA